MGNVTEDRSLSAIAERAAEWFVEQRTRDLSAAERQEFATWLQASPVHITEYLAIAATSQALAAPTLFDDADLQQLIAAATKEPAGQPPNVISLRDRLPLPVAAAKTHQRTWLMALAASAVFGLLLIGGLRGWFTPGQRYEVAGEGQGVWRLSDGSIMHLNAHSSARVYFTAGERQVELQRGQAMFEVAHQVRQFRVITDFGAVVAVGTRFEVLREPQRTQVTVLAGTVSVAAQGQLASRLQWNSSKKVMLTSGQRLTMDQDGVAGPLEAVKERDVLAWMRRELVFDRQPLALLVAEFNRYTVLPIRIEDEELAKLPISGVFNAYDSASFLQFLQRMSNVRISIDADQVRVSRKRVGQATPPQAV